MVCEVKYLQKNIMKISFCLVILLVNSLAKASSLISASTELCGYETEIELTKNGDTSSASVTLSPTEHNSICKLRVTSPKTHAINMQFVETSEEVQSMILNSSDLQHPPCVMSILLPQNPRVPVWKGDVCSGSAMPEIDLLTSDFKILWNPPSNPVFTRGRKLVLTAVGQGAVCKEPGQHTCMRIGWDPMMCVSDNLLCNGVPNCPPSATTSDEDEKLCRKHFYAPVSLEQLAVELFKKFKPQDLMNNKNNKWLHESLEKHVIESSSSTETIKISGSDWREWHELKKTESTTTAKPVMAKKSKAADSISQVLSKYGPWGYLMLGMLICGTVLMFCGLWECCFRKPKGPIDILEANLQNQPTTVLIINPQEGGSTPSPPNYDDLDQPPSYTTLFPNYKRNSGSSVPVRESGDRNDSPQTVNSNVDVSDDSSNNSQRQNIVEEAAESPQRSLNDT